MMHYVTLNDMINARLIQKETRMKIFSKYQVPIIMMTVNIPGEIKCSDDILNVFLRGRYEIEKLFLYNRTHALHREERHVFTGDEYYCAVDEDAVKLKRWMISLEETLPLGRLLNIDVYDIGDKRISRKILGYPERKCLLCEQNAADCMKFRHHTEQELRKKILEMMENVLYARESDV